MTDTSTPLPEAAERLFKLRAEIESLTRGFVTQLLQSQASAETQVCFLNTIFKSIGAGLLVFDEHLNVVLANEAAIRLAGGPLQNLTRADLRQRYSFFVEGTDCELSPEEEPIVVALREKRTVEVEGVIKGEQFPPEGVWVRIQASPIMEGDRIIGGVSVFHNITERVRLQRQHDCLAALITHDLKNHLVSEAVLLELLIEQYSDQIDAEEVALLADLKKSNVSYLEVITALVELFRTKTFKSEFAAESIDPIVLLQSVIELDKQAAALKRVHLQFETADSVPLLRGIFTALRHVLHNLVQNAINASDFGQEVCLRVSADPDNVIIEVVDYGKGMPPEMASLIFEPSRMATRFSTSLISSGFGLYMSRLLIEAQNGTLSCIAAPGKGSTFKLKVPRVSDH